jgi:deazaflavin-dependent oxidoreductase (nitroreductase family)
MTGGVAEAGVRRTRVDFLPGGAMKTQRPPRSTDPTSAPNREPRRGLIRRLYWVKRWMYRRGRPQLLARAINHLTAMQFSAGLLSPARAMTLEVRGRRTGRPISFPVVVADHRGGRYVVSMLGNEAGWVRNVRAAGGRAALCRGGRQEVQLREVPIAERAPILQRYLALAPGARPHIPVDPHAPLPDFERIAAEYPVFRVEAPATAATATTDATPGGADEPA